ncbi:hypothetical protein DSECCO2_272550 [anaerobic digester metagenome]|nr:hypothetical protein [Methanobacterium sp. YSL]
MKPFSMVAKPHKDIFEKKLRMDVFAADLWYVFKEEGPEEYKDPNLFFKKTYLTQGLNNILDVAKMRLKGEGGDPIVQLQTPFGGGKTHTLIALYHKAHEMGANVVVIDGTALDPKDVNIWEEMERQLSGKIDKLKGPTSPGKDKLRDLLVSKQPVMILIDELLEYATKASGIDVGRSNLASQLLAFIQELTAAISTVENSMMILTLPSSETEHFDSEAEALYHNLSIKIQKVVGRVEMIYTPVQDEEIYPVIRRRLFSSVDEVEAENIVDEFIDYADQENILPKKIDKSEYKKKFIQSYPFQPEVIDILYTRWGSFPEFQRTRGVLRFLSLIVNSLRNSKNSLIHLSDFDLNDETIKRELLKYAGHEYDAIIASDITLPTSGSKEVDVTLGSAYLPYHIGTKASTTMFLYSFPTGLSGKNGASIKEIQLSCIDVDIPSNIIEVAINRLEDNLLYLHSKDNRYLFLNKITLNRVKEIKKEGITDEMIQGEEENLLNKILGKRVFDVYKWPYNSKDIPDTKNMKLIVENDNELLMDFLENYGNRPRVYRNTLIFLTPLESERGVLRNAIKDKLAWKLVIEDKLLDLTPDQKNEVIKKIKELENDSKEFIRNLYRLIFLPSLDGLKEIDLGRHPYGMDHSIEMDIQKRLKNEDELTEKLSPLIIREKYLKGKRHVETVKIHDSFYKTPGEIRITSQEVFKRSIREGVKEGLFGLGDFEDDKPYCKFYKKACSPELVHGELLIDAEICINFAFEPPTSEEIKNEVLKSDDYVETLKILQLYSKLNPAVDKMIICQSVQSAIIDGVKKGDFGLGIKEDEKIKCISFKKDCLVDLEYPEIIINPDLCKENPPHPPFEITPEDIKNLYLDSYDFFETQKITESIVSESPELDFNEIRQNVKVAINQGIKRGYFLLGILDDGTPKCLKKDELIPKLTTNEIIVIPELCKKDIISEIELELEVSLENVADIIKMIAYLKGPFDDVETKAKFNIIVKDGEISASDYENKIKETLEQLDISPSVELTK